MSGNARIFEGKPWMPIPLEVLESDAWHSLSINGHRLISFLMREHMRHGGKHNGKLKAPRRQLERFGIGARFVSNAIAKAEELGLIECQRNGLRTASTYALTWLPMHDGTPATNQWLGYRNPTLASLPTPKSKNLTAKGKSGLVHKGKSVGPNLLHEGKSDCPESLVHKGKHLLRSSFQGGRFINDLSKEKVMSAAGDDACPPDDARLPSQVETPDSLPAGAADALAPWPTIKVHKVPTDPIERMAFINTRAYSAQPAREQSVADERSIVLPAGMLADAMRADARRPVPREESGTRVPTDPYARMAYLNGRGR
jgi:hypothetical protein